MNDNADSSTVPGYQERLAFETREFRHLRQGAYSDILFIMLPFLAIFFQRMWSGEFLKMFTGPEIAIACTVLGGLSISKFAQSLTNVGDLGPHKDNITMAIAAALFVVLTPASILTLKLSSDGTPPFAIAFLQPLLLIISIGLYVAVIRITRMAEMPFAEAAASKAAAASTEKTVDGALPPPTLAPFELDAFGATEVDADSPSQTRAAS
jgi:uncharacterized membrane protein YccF (DUF307 family)